MVRRGATLFLATMLALIGWNGASRAQGQPAAPSAAQEPSSRPSFVEWLQELRAEALARGFGAALIDRAFDRIEPLPVVLERDRGQVERTIAIEQYIARRVTPAIVRTARTMRDRHRATLRTIESTYGVPARIVVAIWGLESNFGRFTGVRPTIAALATLAYDERRARFFRAQLFDALTIVHQGDVELERLTGSWAGAMGQTQFMPSSYLRYAVDADGDGRRDIWTSHADVFGSIANYLREHGWAKETIWGREVQSRPGAGATIAAAASARSTGCEAERQMSAPLPLARWSALGVRLPGGKPLPRADLDASLLRTGKRMFLVYRNYEALLGYNCAHAYALSVALLADRIGN